MPTSTTFRMAANRTKVHAMNLRTFTHAISRILLDDAPTRFCPSLPDDTWCHVTIERREGAPPVWDTCHVNDKWVGNRHGAVAEFLRLWEAAQAAQDAATRVPQLSDLLID